MPQIISKFLLSLSIVLVALLSYCKVSAEPSSSVKTEMRLKMKDLFSHKTHDKHLTASKISCTECHNFAIKSPGSDPLSKNVPAGFLVPDKKVCHQCHMGKVELPRINQCSLCHLNPDKLKPESHFKNWRTRHGNFAQADPESCTSCHRENQNACINCHTQRNTLKPMVHRPNFRLTHSIEARGNPAKCINCHTNLNTCTSCHKGGFP